MKGTIRFSNPDNFLFRFDKEEKYGRKRISRKQVKQRSDQTRLDLRPELDKHLGFRQHAFKF